jgi:hypothetical protein
MEEGKSYPVLPNCKPYIWWFLTSRRSQAWDYDENGLTAPVGAACRESWGHAWLLVKHGSWLGSRLVKLNYRLFIRQRPCGCSYNWLTRRTRGILLRCPEHGFAELLGDDDE